MKKYTIFSIIFIALISLGVYIQNDTFTTLNIGKTSWSLPNALWVALFLTLFFLTSLIFFGIIHFRSFVYQKNVKKDLKIIIENIKNRVLYKNSIKPTKTLNEINECIKNIKGLEIKPQKRENYEFFEDIEKLKNGEIVEISKYKLNENNPWFKLNIKNRLKNEPEYAKEVLKKFQDKELKKEAFYIWAKTAGIKEILREGYPITYDIIKSHLHDEYFHLLLSQGELKLSIKEEIELAKEIYGSIDPDSELEMLKPLKWAEAYLTIKYEHLELAKEIIDTNNLKFFDYFLKLKEEGQKVDIDEYIQSAQIF